MADAVVGDAVSKLSDVIIHVMKKSLQFRSTLAQLQETITKIKPIFTEIEKLNKVLDRPAQETEMFIDQLKGAEDLVRKCEHIKWNLWKRYRHSLKLDDLNASLLRFFQIDVQLQQIRDVKEVLVVVKDVQKRMEKGGSGGWFPLLKSDVIGFDDQLRDLKAMVIKDSMVDDCSVVVVLAEGGCGKTTLVTKLCHDTQIQGKFGRNIYFATISETPNLKVVIKNLLPKNQSDHQLDFTSNEDAVHRWGSFLRENKSEILLVLDDVWDESVVRDFRFKLRGYKILMVICCKGHPLALSVIGGLLKRAHVDQWRIMLNKLSEGQQSVIDFDKDMRLRLARSLDMFEEDSEIKQCYLDLGSFPEDQEIAATTLMDIWVNLYNHDEKGSDTLSKLFELSSKNLATMLPIRKDSSGIVNFCEDKAVVQHDMMRALAIYLTSQDPEEHRKRLIINVNGQDFPQLPHTVNARLMSISTDENFSMIWNGLQAPKVEAFVLNFISDIYALPPFMKNMERLKVLIITNNGYYFSQLQNFPTPQYLSRLARIRLEHVSIASISTSLLELVNLRKLSLIMCKIGNSFNECIPNKLPNLLEIEIDSCDDLVTFPPMLCNLVRLKKLSITNCLELVSLSEGFGNLTNLEGLRLTSCSYLTDLPVSMRNLHKLSIIDISHCLHLCALPTQIGEWVSLRTIHMRGCTGLHELPSSIKDLCPLKVVCDEEIKLLWSHFPDVKVEVVEEDRWSTFSKIISRGMHVH
ncbi:hypothetical protein OSB04_016536 [Centaurea solstitialis]|uniref:RPW8 domain-containing protein n=1 Tax=Centaurea solstitialis TaxID=347529 RepID=A0AA38TC71_9ASTR|nr:hypothetical protein OSB04_016536 [Centaurea solstitialis]